MANATTPAFKYNGPAIEAFVPTDSGATIRCPKGMHVVGSYYSGVLIEPSWTTVADAADVDSSLIVYENMGELGNKLVFVPVPAASDATGNAGDVAVTVDSVSGAITSLYLCITTGVYGERPTPEWMYFEPTTWP